MAGSECLNFCSDEHSCSPLSGVLPVQFAPTWLLLRTLLCRSPLQEHSALFWVIGFRRVSCWFWRAVVWANRSKTAALLSQNSATRSLSWPALVVVGVVLWADDLSWNVRDVLGTQLQITIDVSVNAAVLLLACGGCFQGCSAACILLHASWHTACGSQRVLCRWLLLMLLPN